MLFYFILLSLCNFELKCSNNGGVLFVKVFDQVRECGEMADLGEESSDDEVYFGKMTLKEVKKNIWLNGGYNRTSNISCKKPKLERSSIKIIQTHSLPNLHSMPLSSLSPLGSTHDNRKSDESFIQMENLVSKLCLSPEKAAELNNTLDIVDYILNNGPQDAGEKDVEIEKTKVYIAEISPDQATNQKDIQMEKTEDEYIPDNSPNQATNQICTKIEKTEDEYIPDNSPNQATNQICMKIKKTEDEYIPDNSPKLAKNQIDMEIVNTENDMKIKQANAKDLQIKNTYLNKPLPKKTPKKVISTPVTHVKKTPKTSPKYYTPVKSPKKQADVFLTPSSNMLESEKRVFKTPNSALKMPSVSSLRATTSKTHMYKHIKSPIATYIKKTLQSPMVSNICPKKTLVGCSSENSKIPKLVKPQGKHDKENIALRTVAYKSAKNTKVVQTVDKEKPCLVPKKLLSTLQQPTVVLKHDMRQFNFARKPLKLLPEDSIDDLSCLQADLSVCTPVKPKH